MQDVTAAILAKLCADFVLELMSMCAPTKNLGFSSIHKIMAYSRRGMRAV